MSKRNTIVLGCILLTLALFLVAQVLWLYLGKQPTDSIIVWRRITITASACAFALSILCFWKGKNNDK